ncbi:uncharacterized protein LOC119091340 isoform X2 [Pollicipes pollicipes]|uniref:uncharacterized protein LOC119091340 isoform X2 n=1 Tax=Pollicipes pollicipes TaxID=41117 RepID=UPI001884F6A2|nr:uncharacterized protein LOC119091340 isoform X2 [Pollicipes pollicipes]
MGRTHFCCLHPPEGVAMPGRRFVGFDVASDSDVSPCWRWLPLLTYVLLMLLSMAASRAVGTTVGHFHGQCPLYAVPRVSAFDGVNVTLNERASDPGRSSWGDAHVCDMAEFFPIFVIIFSASWFFFFCMCGKGGKGSAEGFGMNSPWRIVCPGLVFNLVLTLAALVCGVWTSGGVHVFCQSLEQSGFGLSCAKLNGLRFPEYPEVSQLQLWFTIAEVCSWLVFCGLLFVTLLLALRCCWRPDLTPRYEPCRVEAGGRRPSSDSFVTADSTPRHGPGGDGAHIAEAVTPLIHHSADQ